MNYDIISGQVDTKTIRLEAQRIACEYGTSLEFINNATYERYVDEVGRKVVHAFAAQVATRKYDVKTVRFPADWVETLKRRFAPRWFLIRFPVKYTEVTLEANAYYPGIQIDGQSVFVRVVIGE